MKCSNCGADMPDDAPFCPSCGASRDAGSSSSPFDDPLIVSSADDAQQRHGVVLASLGRRFGARALDGLIIAVVFVLLFAIVSSDDITSGSVSGGMVIFAIIFGIAYEVVMVAYQGQTLGKMALGVKVVRSGDRTELPSIGSSVARWGVPSLLGLVPVLGFFLTILVYLSATWDRERQGWHDKAASTVVVMV